MPEMLSALLLQPKISDDGIVCKKTPFIGIPMLKESAPFQIVLTHRSRQYRYRCRHKSKRLLELSECQMKCLLITVEMPIEEVGIFIEPHCQCKRSPADHFVYEQLSTF